MRYVFFAESQQGGGDPAQIQPQKHNCRNYNLRIPGRRKYADQHKGIKYASLITGGKRQKEIRAIADRRIPDKHSALPDHLPDPLPDSYKSNLLLVKTIRLPQNGLFIPHQVNTKTQKKRCHKNNRVYRKIPKPVLRTTDT